MKVRVRLNMRYPQTNVIPKQFVDRMENIQDNLFQQTICKTSIVASKGYYFPPMSHDSWKVR